MHSSSTMVLLVMISIFWTTCQGLETTATSTTRIPVSLTLSETSPATDNSSFLSGFDTTTPGTDINHSSMATESLSTINSSTTYVSSMASSLTTTNIINAIDVTTPRSINGSNDNTTDIFTTFTTFNASETSAVTHLPSTSSYDDLSTTATGETSTSSVTNSTPSTSNNGTSTAATSVTSTMLTYTTGNSSTNQSGIAGNDRDSVSPTGVILGAVFGSILGIALVCIVAYVLCGTIKAKEFSHRRLYEDIRHNPVVLRLDNPISSYDVSYGDSSFFNPTVTEEMPYNDGRTHETIVMEDLKPH